MIRSTGHINSLISQVSVQRILSFHLVFPFDNLFSRVKFRFVIRITDFRTTVARITQLLIRPVMNEKRREIFFPPRDNNRFFHFPRLARAQVIRESGESAGRGGGGRRGEERSPAFPCPVRRVRGGGTSSSPPPPPSSSLFRSFESIGLSMTPEKLSL